MSARKPIPITEENTLIRRPSNIEKHRWAIAQRDAYLKGGLEQQIVDDTLNQETLPDHPSVIKQLELRWHLPITGNLEMMLRHYRETYYTRNNNGFLGNVCKGAAKWGHKDVFKRELRGVNERRICEYATIATEFGQLRIIKWLVKHYAKPIFLPSTLHEIAIQAADGNWIEIIKYMASVVPTFLDHKDTMLEFASFSGHLEVVTLMIEWGANNYNAALREAADGGQLGIVNFLLDHGANKLHPAAYHAAKNGYSQIVERLLAAGANNYLELLQIAAVACSQRLSFIDYDEFGLGIINAPTGTISDCFGKDIVNDVPNDATVYETVYRPNEPEVECIDYCECGDLTISRWRRDAEYDRIGTMIMSKLDTAEIFREFDCDADSDCEYGDGTCGCEYLRRWARLYLDLKSNE